MSNKYIEKFFLLTEQNIIANSQDTVNENHAQCNLSITNRTDYIKYFCGSLVLVGLINLFFNIQTHKMVSANIVFPKTHKIKLVASIDDPILRSVIPSFNTQSRRQFLQQVDLKRLDLAMIEDSNLSDNYRAQAHLTDKVLVAPKSFG